MSALPERPGDFPGRAREYEKVPPLAKVLDVLMTVVNIMDNLSAIVTGPHGDECPPCLHPHLVRFTQILQNTLSLHQTATSLGQAVAALQATPGVTWAQVTREVTPWLESLSGLSGSWAQVCSAAQVMFTPFRDQDGPVGTATGWGQGWSEAQELVGRLVCTCGAAQVSPEDLERWFRARATQEGAQMVSPGDIEFLVAAVTEFQQLWGDSPRPDTSRLQRRLGDIERLLSGGPRVAE